MKKIGIARKVGDKGRFVLPIELRRTLHIVEGDNLELYLDGDAIRLEKYQPACVFCGEAQDLVSFQGKTVCPACRAALAAI